MSRRKPAADRKADIVAATLVLADRIGPDRLTTNDVAREVGVTQAAIFRHFPTKAELWAAVGEALSLRLTRAWDEALAAHAAPDAAPLSPPPSTPHARLRALIGTQLRQIEASPALPAILHSRELGVDNAALRNSCANLVQRFHGHLVANLRALSESGALRRDLPAEDAATLLVSLVQGVAIRWTLGARNFSLPDEGLRLFDLQLALFTRDEAGP